MVTYNDEEACVCEFNVDYKPLPSTLFWLEIGMDRIKVLFVIKLSRHGWEVKQPLFSERNFIEYSHYALDEAVVRFG